MHTRLSEKHKKKRKRKRKIGVKNIRAEFAIFSDDDNGVLFVQANFNFDSYVS